MANDNEFDNSFDPMGGGEMAPMREAGLPAADQSAELPEVAQPTQPVTPVSEQPVQPTVPVVAPVNVAPAAAATPVAVTPAVPTATPTEIPGVRDASIGGLQLTEMAAITKAKLALEPKVQIVIPLDAGEKKGAYRSVTINGYRCEIKKNVMVSVPKSIAALVMSAYQTEYETLNNNEYNLADADAEKKKALGL